MHDFQLSSRQADSQLAGKSLSHMQTLDYHDKICLKYVIFNDYIVGVKVVIYVIFKMFIFNRYRMYFI